MNTGFVFAVAAFWTFILLNKVEFDPVHYQTVDGKYYQQLAQSFLNGKPMVLDGLTNAKGNSFSPYPPGFPVLLALFHQLTGFSFSTSAIFLHGLFLLVLLLLFRNSFLGSLLIVAAFSDTGLELGANCWSEFSFLALILVFGYFIIQSSGEPKWQDGFILGILGVLCFMIRYSAVFLISFLVWKIAFASSLKLRNNNLKALILFILFYVGWTYWQLHLTGLPTGGDRYPNEDSIFGLTVDFFRETGNQLALFKNPVGSHFAFFFLAIIGQISMAIWVVKISHHKLSNNWTNGLLFSQLGLFYLMFISPVRGYFYFAESFDCRLLGPGFFLLVMGLGSRISAFQSSFQPKRWLVIYMLLSALFFLPKKAILEAAQIPALSNSPAEGSNHYIGAKILSPTH